MTWEEAYLEMEKGNIITTPNSPNYCLLYAPNHILVFCEPNRLYHISSNKRIKEVTDYIVDNTKRDIINNLVLKLK